MPTPTAVNPFHDYLASRLAEKVAKRQVAVWYDPREEFRGFIAELRGQREITACRAETVKLGGRDVRLICKNGSLFETKLVAEPFVDGETIEPLLIYLPGERVDQPTLNALLELEKAGTPVEWKLAQMARHCLQQFIADDQIDQVLMGESSITYADVVNVLAKLQSSGGGRPGSRSGSGSILDAIFQAARTSAEQLAAWLATPSSDSTIENKGGRGEILRLVAKLGMSPESSVGLEKLRLDTVRHVLVGEFVLDLKGERPPSTGLVVAPSNIEQEKLLRQTADAFRRGHADQYEAMADQIEAEFQLSSAGVSAERLGSIDTFRFEEKLLLSHAGQLVADGRFSDAREIVTTHARSFWADRDARRQQQWEACGRMGALGEEVARVRAALPAASAGPSIWFRGYTNLQSGPESGWFKVDTLYRQLQSHLASMADVPDSEAAQHAVLNAYDELAGEMTARFMGAMKAASWQVPGDVLRQPQVFDEIVSKPTPDGSPVAMILADSLRYEMGVELAAWFNDAKSIEVKAAAAAIPTITPIGMAALLPGASRSFDVVDGGERVGARIEGKVMTGLKDRMTFLQGKVPGSKDIELNQLLAITGAQLKSRLHGVKLIVVRAQEIDEVGENAHAILARQVMETAVSNIARGIRKLAQNGVSRFIIVADHGHIFGRAKDEAMRIDPPGGQTVELHRRCWIGRGGVTPSGTVRISAAELGHDSDIDLVFPVGTGVFKAGGDLAYHHGGLSLQELVVPVVVLELAAMAAAPTATLTATVGDVPAKITNRTFRVTLTLTADGLFTDKTASVRVSLVHKGLQVGSVGHAIDAQFDAVSKTVKLEIGKAATILMLLQRDDAKQARLVIEDATSRAVLYQSDTDLPIDVL
ncbi:MAG: PglZ domain-containing protein [Phycisphaerales bacterium]|nr:PglZ domain-containing protein [Phycisphaerales bacterium]